MCRKITCPKCGLATITGCGLHVEEALAGVPASARCRCDGAALDAASGAAETGVAGGTAVGAATNDATRASDASSAPGVRELATLHAHNGAAWCVAWQPTAQSLLASCGADKAVHVWTSSGERWFQAAALDEVHTRTVRRVAWAPNGACLAACSFDATFSIWRRDADSGELEWATTVDGHENEVKVSNSRTANSNAFPLCFHLCLHFQFTQSITHSFYS